MKDKISKEKLLKYFDVTERALEAARISSNRTGMVEERKIIFDMAQRYFSDARYYFKKGDLVTAFASLNYAHGWLDAGARLGIFDVHDSELFTAE